MVIKFNYIRFYLTASLLWVSLNGNSQDFQSRLKDTLQAYWEISSGIPGVGLVVITPTKDTVFTSVGIGNTLSSTPIDEHSQFIAASISKTFTTALILRMQEEGLVSIDSLLSTYLFIPDLDSTLTIRQIMNHSSGVYDHFDDDSFWTEAVNDPYKFWTNEEVLSYSIPHGLTHTPGDYYNYSNTGFYILGMLIEEVLDGLPRQSIHDWVTEPIGLFDTFLDDSSTPDDKIPGLAENHRAYEYHKSPVSTAGAIVSTPKEIAKFLETIFVGDFLSDESKNLMTTASMKNSGYGLGTIRWYSDGGTYYYGHTGTLSGYKNITYHIPSINTTVAIMSNGYADPGSGWWNLVDAIFETVFSEFNNCDNGICPVPLAPIVHKVISNASGNTEISWALNTEDYVSGYRLYYSTLDDPENWALIADEAVLSKSTNSFIFNTGSDFLAPDESSSHLIQLVAVTSDGKESPHSDIYGYTHDNQDKRMLIVDGFDRFGGSGSWPTPTHQFGADYLALFKSISGRDFDIDMTSNEMISIDSLDLNEYDYVAWFVGDESTSSETFSSEEQIRIKSYLEYGGNLFVTGSEIGWDLDQKGSSIDQDFYANYLKSSLSDDGTLNNGPATSVSETAFAGVSLAYGNVYNEDYPDELIPINGASPILNYKDGSKAGIAYTGGFGASEVEGRMVYLAFPLESVSDASAKSEFAKDLIYYFNNLYTSASLEICEGDSIQLGEAYITQSGTFSETFPASNGYDSIVTYTVNVHPGYEEQINAEIRQGDVYTFDNQSITEAGTYTAHFQTIHGCDSTVTLTLDIILGFAEQDENWVSIYPNPFSNRLNVKVTHADQLKKITFIDLSGRITLNINLHGSNEKSIDVSAFPSGIYRVIIESESGKTYKQTLIKN